MRRDPLANPEELIRRVYAYAAYRLGPGPEAEDVTSETFARAVRYRDSFDPKRGEPLSWLIGIARRCIATAASPELAAAEPHAEDTGDPYDAIAERLDLAAAVQALSPRDRELIALRFGADLTAGQIGELLELKTNAVEVALHRALGRLRNELGSPPPGAGAQAGSSTISLIRAANSASE